jgi:hypothetical protein
LMRKQTGSTSPACESRKSSTQKEPLSRQPALNG